MFAVTRLSKACGEERSNRVGRNITAFDFLMRTQRKMPSVDSAPRKKWLFALTNLEDMLPFGRL